MHLILKTFYLASLNKFKLSSINSPEGSAMDLISHVSEELNDGN